jgi:hypothetical protein
MDRRFEQSSSDPERQKRPSTNSEKTKLDSERQKEKLAHSEKIKNEKSHFKPLESNTKLNRENNTEHKSPEATEPKDAPSVEPEGKFGPGWSKQQWEIWKKASGNLRNELNQKLRDQPIEADARDRQNEIPTYNSSNENITQQNRKYEKNYRLFTDHMLRSKL